MYYVIKQAFPNHYMRMRRLPVYILINTAIDNLKIQEQEIKSLEVLIRTIQKTNNFQDITFISVIGYNESTETITPLTNIYEFNLPQIEFKSGYSSLTKAVASLCEIIERNKIKTTCEYLGDYRPLVYIITGSDLECGQVNIRHLLKKKHCQTSICSSQEALELYQDITTRVVSFDNFNESFIDSSLIWISASIDAGERIDRPLLNFPPPPEFMSEIVLDIDTINRSTITYSPICPIEPSDDTIRLKDLQSHKSTVEQKLSIIRSRITHLKDLIDKSEPELRKYGMFSAIASGLFACIGSIISPAASVAGQVNGAPNKSEKNKSYKNELKECESQIHILKNQIKTLEKEIEKIKASERSVHKVYSSIFAASEVKCKSNLLTQVFLHLADEINIIKSFANEADPNAERKGYTPLSIHLSKGDKIDIEFKIYGDTQLMSERKSIVWQGEFAKCSFRYFVPEDINVHELYCEVCLIVNGALIGEMSYITNIVETPRNLNPEILAHRYNKIFISYAHQDAQQAKLLALAYKAQGVDYFFDRDCLSPGDVYEEKIFSYIDTSDLFVLCWSQNAAKSAYVAKEKGRALQRAYPQLSIKDAKLKICPISMAPRADLPDDMVNLYNFEII